MTFSFTITATQGFAKRGVIQTPNGEIQTPEFVPVATNATLKALSSHDLQDMGAQCALSNTYHLYLRPGLDVLTKAKGVRNFMNFHKPWFSDSGGFQAFSLGYGMEHNVTKQGIFAKHTKTTKPKKAFINDKGVTFQSVYDGTTVFMDAKLSMHIQDILDSDIIMAFDECTGVSADYEYNKKALHRTNAWAIECLRYKAKRQALYGIIQGSTFKDLRLESLDFTLSKPFEGIAIGGCLGETKEEMRDILSWVAPQIAQDKRPVHLLGIGAVEDIFEGVAYGCDTFDCVLPTRNARRGSLFITPKSGGTIQNRFHLNIGNTKYKDDFTPIDMQCTCSTCQTYTKAYLHHLYKRNEMNYHRLASIHNVYFLLNLLKEIRQSIEEQRFDALYEYWLQKKLHIKSV